MELCTAPGACYFPQCGHRIVPAGVWSQRLRSAPTGALRLRAGRLIHRTLINPIGIDLPVTDRTRRSASEP